MNPLRRLASQTAIYGISSIAGRFINYLLVPLFTYHFTPQEYGVVSEFYAYAGFLAVLLTFGFETGYFRFRERSGSGPDTVYATALRFVLAANFAFLAAMLLGDGSVAHAVRHGDHPEYVAWMAAILAADAVGSIAFARLRAQERALRFAGIKVLEILVNVGLCLLLIIYCQDAAARHPDSMLAALWNPAIGVGYVFIANLAASGVKLLLLSPQLAGIRGGFDAALFRRMLRYSLPMVVIGLAGVTNEMLDRALMKYLLPYDAQTNLAQLGIYSACYKLSILMSLFIQAFRYASEPFFFAHAGDRDARLIYAEVLTYFVIFCVAIFLLVSLYIDIFQFFIGPAFRAGLDVVPVLLLANLMLGIYVNLSIWYKLTDRTLMGAGVALAGGLITVVCLLAWVPRLGYMGAAWATLTCYASMALASYLLGRRYYPVPYDHARVLGYCALGIALYLGNGAIIAATGAPAPAIGTLTLAVYLAVVWVADGRALWQRLRAG